MPEGNFEGFDQNQDASAHALEYTDLVGHEFKRISPFEEWQLTQAGTSELDMQQVKEILPNVKD